MKRGKIAPMMLLVLCIALVLSIVPTSVFAAQTTEEVLTGTKLTASHAGQTLQAGEYYVEPNTTLELRGGTGKSGLKVADNATVTIYIPESSTLKVYGGAASGTTGAGAGIEVNSGSTVKITGAGKLYAYGGNAANGSNGAKGDDADWVDDGNSYIPDGGYGGAGGGGAGAGIGTKGGNGGSGAGWTLGFYGGRRQSTNSFMNANYSGQTGGNGSNGANANACGDIYISADVNCTPIGGAAGTSGGAGGGRGASDYESDDSWMRGIAGGAGGGGGGAGKAGAKIGTGGGGGGGGGAGGGVGYAWSYQFLGAGGGGGGGGAVSGSGGAWGPDGTIPNCKKFQYFSGKEFPSYSGNSGTTTNGGEGGQGAKVKITNWAGTQWQWPYGGNGGKGGAAGGDFRTKDVQLLYQVSIEVEEETIGVYDASASEFLPASIAVPVKAGHTFEGFYAGDVAYYDASGARTTAKITADTTISAKFKTNSYNIGIESDPGSTGGGAGVSGPVNYGDAITLTTPTRAGYLFRGWKISATSGSINQAAYYTYTAAARMRTSGQVSENFIYGNGAAMTAGFEKIGNSITVYNLSADDDAQIKIEEMWARDSFIVTFKDFDGTTIGTVNGTYGTAVNAPVLPDHQNEYYSYRFLYWKCNIDGKCYTSEQMPDFGAFLEWERSKGDQVYDGVTFTAVYETTYHKEIEFTGSLGNTLNNDGKLVLNSTDTNVEIITNFKITKNDGVAALLLIPQYDANVFSIKAISVNGKQFGAGVSSSEVLGGFNVTVTKDLNSPVKILLDNILPDKTTSNEIFIQIIYVMNNAVGGEYQFGFVTNNPTNTDEITHGDRSEAYGTYDPDANDQTDAYKFNELKISVNSSAIQVVIRANGEITIAPNQSFVYNGQQMSAADITEMIERALQYTYNGFTKDKNAVTIKWYDAQGNQLSGAPKNAGTYKIGISAAETTYYTAAEVQATFTITPYQIFVSAGDQSVVYNGSNATINTSAAGAGIYIKDVQGNLISADDFVYREVTLTGVKLQNSYIDAGTYANAIRGVLSYNSNNYKVNYVDGTLTITKALNSWITTPVDKSEEYSGNPVAIGEARPEFGTIQVEYLVGYDKDGNEEWSANAPTNAGTYPVRVTVTGNNNYYDLECEVTLEITKKVISANGFTFEAIDKYYNGENQYWSTDPNGDKNSSDTEVTLIATDANAAILQYVKFAGILNPNPTNCKNVGTYTIQAILQISNPNYTFVKDGENVDSWTYDVSAKILKRKIVVVVGNQSAEYTGSEPTVNKGQAYVTIRLENGTVADFVNLDFFGGEVYVFAGDRFDANARYFVLDNKVYRPVELTQDQFNSNQSNKNTEDFIQYYVLQHQDSVETLTLVKAPGVNAGQYALTAMLSNSGNYELVTVNKGNFTITKKLVAVPTLDALIYNGEFQFPTAPDNVSFSGERKKNVGTYQLTAALRDKNNYAWKDSSVSDDRVLNWSIDKKTITLVLADGSYQYGTSVQDILTGLNPSWKNNDGPFADDQDTTFDKLSISFGQGTYPQVGTHNVSVSQGSFNANYQVLVEGGTVVIIRKVLTQQELQAQITAAIKYYTGEPLVLNAADFTINLFDYNDGTQPVLAVTSVNTNGHVDANGWMNGSTFTYYPQDGKIYVTVTVALADAVNANYELEEGANTFDVEAYIAKAENRWTSGPAVNATTITNIQHSAQALFGGNYTVKFYEDENCTNEVTDNNFAADTTYYAKFTVDGNKNYSGLETVIIFSGGHITVIKPVVTLDGNVVTEVTKITYDGQVHTFDIPNSSQYTVTYESAGDCKSVGTYTVTITLNNLNYRWDDETSAALTYTLTINKKALTITAESYTITFGDEAPQYMVASNGLVNGETLTGLLGGDLASYIRCTYSKNDNADNYPILLLATIEDVLTNYEVTLTNGTLTVNKRAYSYDDILATDGKTFAELIANGPSFIYDGVSKKVTAETYPDVLEITVVYYKDGIALPVEPVDAGEYTVEIRVKVKAGQNSNNYDLPETGKITLTIHKATITITVNDQTYAYDGNDHSTEITNGTHTITVSPAQTLNGNVTLTISGTYINAGTYADQISATHTYNTDNYDVTIVNGDLIIRKVNNDWDAALRVESNLVYDKNAIESGVDFFSDPKFGDEYIQYTFFEKIGESWVQLSVVPTKAGEYAVEASVPETSNYYAITSSRVEFRIQKKKITIDGISFVDAEFTYNGQPHVIHATAEEDILALFSISYNGNGQINAGTYTVIANFLPADDRNYEIEGENAKSATLTIKAVQVTITAEDQSSMYGEEIRELTYSILFADDRNDNSFYRDDFGTVTLSTNATSQSDVGAYDITIHYTSNSNYVVDVVAGTYQITKFTGNAIVDLQARTVNYLMDLIYSASAKRGEVVFTFSRTMDGEYTTELPKDVDTYYVKATVLGTDNYDGAEAITSFKIVKAKLSSITGLTYHADTATWTAVVTTTDGKTIDCDVTYVVDGMRLTTPSFTATKAGEFAVSVVPEDIHNYMTSEAVALNPVYSVTFADKVENHVRQDALADLTDPAFATKYLFAGQTFARPGKTPEVVGYTFRAWQLGDADYTFVVGVWENITLYADWTVKSYTITFYNEVVTGSSVVGGIFQEGAISTEQLYTHMVEYGEAFDLNVLSAPTKDADEIYTYAFAYWAAALRGDSLGNSVTVYGDMDIFAVYSGEARKFTITYMVSVDGGAYQVHEEVTLPYGSAHALLENVTWFVGDVWYTDTTRETAAPEFVMAQNITLYGAYVFDIGAGDVNGDGKINTNDIVNYRRWVVGGYDIITVEKGKEWELVTSGSYDPNAIYYLARVSDANYDESGDIRDITTIRMAITGGYGYVIETNKTVTGEAVNFGHTYVSEVDNADALQNLFKENVGDIYVKLNSHITLTEVLVLNSGKNVTINLNGYTLTIANVADKYGVAVKNGTLTIAGNGNVIVPGDLGFGTASDTNTGHIVINGGNFVGENASYLFGCFNGSITINDGNFKARYCVLNELAGYNGTATVMGGSFEVTDDDPTYGSFAFLGDVTVSGDPTYLIHTGWNLYAALTYGGTATLVEDVTAIAGTWVEANATINLNGHKLTLPACKYDGVEYDSIYVNNGTLTIEGTGAVEVLGQYGFATSEDTDAGRIVVNGGNFVGENATYIFGCYEGDILIYDGTVAEKLIYIDQETSGTVTDSRA